jgi:HAD superfamily hydrolase (TIGR01490 family)
MQLALFDLDNTLLPIDSDVSWAKFLIDCKIVDADWYAKRNDYFYAQYCAGTLDIYEFLDFQLAPLARHPRAKLDALRASFLEEVIRPHLLPQAKALVQEHQDKGALCAIVTATNSFITGPIAKEFGIDHLIATEIEINAQGEFTGKPSGLPSFREGKITRVEQWLALMDYGISDFHQSTFYSDSFNDLPLLARVTHPVAVNPDARLLAHATEQNWQVLHLFERTESTDD